MIQKEENRYSNKLDSSHLLLFVFSKLRLFIIVGVVTLIISTGVSLVIEERFESNVILFAATQSSIGDAFFEESKQGDLLAYGETEDAERLLQLFNSNEVRSQIITNHNLYLHYDIDLQELGAKTLLQKEYNSNVGADLTRFGSIRINVLDKDPNIARDIANDMVFLVDSLASALRNDRAKNAFKLAEASYKQALLEIEMAENELSQLYFYGIYDFEAQVQGLTGEYGRAVAENNMKGAVILKDDLKRISNLANKYNKQTNFLETAYDQLAILKKRFDLLKVDAFTQLPSSFVVDFAEASDKKFYPIRWLIVLVSVLSTLAMTLILLLIVESLKVDETRSK